MESFPIEAEDHTPSLADDPALGLSHRAKLEILFAVLLALFLGALDQTIVGVALPTIVRDLGGAELYNWVVIAYLLTSTITVPFYGKLSDLYGRKPMLMIGVTIFLIGSALSGLSQDMTQLILFRGIQGIGAGALFPISLAVIGDLFTPQERGKYQGLFGATFGIASLVGPALGGYITDNLSWHWIFYVNIPIGIVSLVVLGRLLPTVKRPNASRNLDYLGAAVFTVAVSALLVGLSNKGFIDTATGKLHEWTDPMVGGLVLIGVVLGIVFVVIESRAKEPIVPLDLWRIRTYAASIISTILISFGFFGAIIFLPRWFQFVAGSSPTESGYQSLPLLAGLIVSSIAGGLIVSRTGRYKIVVLAGLALMAVGLWAMTHLHADTDLLVLYAWMFVTGLGIGPTLSVFTIIVQNAVPFRQLGVATSNLTFFRQIGGSIGLAITGTIFATTLTDEIPKQMVAGGVPKPLVDQFAAGGTAALDRLAAGGPGLGDQILAAVPEQFRAVVEPLIGAIVHAIYEAFTIAVTQAIWVGVIMTVLAFVVALALKEIPLRAHHGEAPAPTSPGSSATSADADGAPAGGAPGPGHPDGARPLTGVPTPD
jgi:EmrB/QacA subfamily drug resistance transporter